MPKLSSKKIIALIILALIAGSLIAGPVLARPLEEEYPQGGPTTTKEEPGNVVAYIYRISLLVAGFVAFASFLYGGFQYLTSAGSPEVMSSAKKRMTASLLGLAILLGIYLILKLINPELLYPDIEPIKPHRGICFYGSSDKNQRCFTESLKEVPVDFKINSIEFMSEREELKGIYLFGEKDWEGNWRWKLNNKWSGDSSASSLSTGGDVKSFYLMWEETGVYLFKKEKCNPDFPNQPYRVETTDIGNLDTYADKVKSVHFKNKVGSGTENNPEFGYIAVFHEDVNYEGNCGIAFGNDPSHPESVTPKCSPRGISNLDSPPGGSYIQSVDSSGRIGSAVESKQVFNYDFGREATGKITFYEKTNYKGDRFELSTSDLKNHGIWRYLEKNNIEYPFSADEKGDKPSDNGEMEEILSVKIEGDLLLIMTRDQGLETYCQVFKKSDPDLSDDYVIREPWDAKIHSIFIIPLNKEDES